VVRAFDTDGNESDDSNEVTLYQSGPGNNNPVACAGPDQTVDEGVSVSLNGSGSYDPDPGDSIASYSWVQKSGAQVTLSNSHSDSPTFIAPNVGCNSDSLVFELTVTDSLGLEDSDTCIVDIPDSFATEVTISSMNNLDRCGTNYLFVTAYDWSNNESGVSVEVCWVAGC